MAEKVSVAILPQAQPMTFIIEPLLARSFDQWVANNRKDVVSEYMGGQLIIATFETPNRECGQIALARDEIPSLPKELQDLLRKFLAIPGKRRLLDLEFAPVEGGA